MVDLSKDNLPNIKDGNMLRNYELCKEGDVAFADASEDTNEVAKVVESTIWKAKMSYADCTLFMDGTIMNLLLLGSMDMHFVQPHFITK